MRYILIFTFLFYSLIAQEKKQQITLGLGSYIQTQPYENVDTIILPSPVIFFDNNLFYVRWSRVGVYFLGDKQENLGWGFSLTAQPRIYGYDSSDIKNMDERETSWEGGLAFSASYNHLWMEIIALTDILDRHDTYIVQTEIGYDIEYNNFSIYPSFRTTYQSSDFSNYYYGVKESETLLNTRKQYIANDGFEFTIQTYIKYPITKKLSTLVNLKADRISNTAINSPIVEQSYTYSGLASLIYTFEY